MIWVFLAYVAYSAQVENWSFTSPLLPRHRDNFELQGASTSLSSFVRLSPSTPNKQGLVISKHTMSLPNFVTNILVQVAGRQPNSHQGMMVLLKPVDTPVTTGNFYGVNANFHGLAVILDTKRNLIIGVENTADKLLNQEELSMDHFCEAPFLNAQITLRLDVQGKEITVSYKKGAEEYTPCFTMPENIGESNLIIAGATSPTDTQTYDVYTVDTVISDDQMEMIADMISDIQTSMREEVSDLKTEIGDITKVIKELPQKDKLKPLQEMLVKTRNQIQTINETVNKLHVSTVSITNTRSQDNSGAFANQIVDTVNKLEAELNKLDEELDVEKVTKKFDTYLTNQQKVQSNNEAVVRQQMNKLESMTKDLANSSGDNTEVYVMCGFLAIVALFGVVLLRKARKLEKAHAM